MVNATPMVQLEGKVVLVTGAAGGQGRAHAKLLTELGATLVLTDLDGEGAAALAAEIGSGAIGLAHDVSSAESWRTVAATVQAEHGRLDVLVNNAGLCKKSPFAETSEQLMRDTVNVNLIGTMLGMQLMLPLMRDGGGSIVNIASTAALAGYRDLSVYSASKWGILGATRSVAIEYGEYGIRVNAICPGAVDTPMASADAREGRGFITRIPIPRAGRPDEISTMVAFLASDAASYCTGHEFTVDGGQAA